MSEFTALTLTDLLPQSAESAVTSAEARGFAAGYADGARRAEREHADRYAQVEEAARVAQTHADARLNLAVQVLAEAAAAVSRTVAPVVEEAEGTLIRAAVSLAEAVIGVELADGDRSARAALGRVLTHPKAAAVKTVHLNPTDLSVLDITAPAGVEFIADTEVARGDAIAHLPVGMIDATIAGALDRATRELVGGAR